MYNYIFLPVYVGEWMYMCSLLSNNKILILNAAKTQSLT